MKKAMQTLQDLIEEAKVRTVWWALCIFAITYFLSHTSKSMWTNVPISILLLSALRVLSQEVEFRWKVKPVRRKTYLSFLEKKQLSLDDSRLSNGLSSTKRKRKIGSPLVEAAVNDFIDKILQDFVVDLWYSTITPDKEVPEQMRVLIIDAIGEISTRVKDINLVDLLTRDMVDLVGKHLDLYRRNQAAIGVEVMGTLSLDERDERLKHHLMASKELHPALISPECEYKVLQRLMGGVLAVVLRPREAQCPLVRSIARELLTSLVIQPLMNLASPGYINELIEYLVLKADDDKDKNVDDGNLAGESSHTHDLYVSPRPTRNSEHSSAKSMDASNRQGDVASTKLNNQVEKSSSTLKSSIRDPLQPRPADWARVLEAATQRRSEVLAPENLENMWTKGRNYKTKRNSNVKARLVPLSVKKNSGTKSSIPVKNLESTNPGSHVGTDDKAVVQVTHGSHLESQHSDVVSIKRLSFIGVDHADEPEDHTIRPANENKTPLKRSSSTSALSNQTDTAKTIVSEGGGAIISEFYFPEFGRHKEEETLIASDMVFHGEGVLHVPKLRSRVVGAYFEKIGSKSFAVYSIAVTDSGNNTWFVKRRYRNFERLHRHLKDIPNYTLHLPPKRFLSSSIDDSFVHQRCIQLDQYLQDLLSIANVAEQHEVWDFLSASSKNYSFGKSTSVMKTLAVNVDDAMDDILRQVKGVSDGLMRKVVGSSSLPCPPPTLTSNRNTTWYGDEINLRSSSYNDMETPHSLSDNEEHDLDGSQDTEEIVSGLQVSGWHSDNELNLKGVPPRVIKRDEDIEGLRSERDQSLEVLSQMIGPSRYPEAISSITARLVEDPVAVPPEWTPPNVSVPLLNLVDNIFQLKRRGWLRRQVFWFSKQILQLVMEDAIDDWLLRQIHWLRRDDIIALGIRWIHDVLWPNGTFFLKLSIRSKMDIQFDQNATQTADNLSGNQASKLGSFELQLEAVRRASDVKKMFLDGAPSTLVSLIGHKQYKRCAKDVYYFLQSNVCVKQLTYGLLELLLISIFPELCDLVLDVHEKI
ncbi:phox domain-containing protein [Thalictrum thalictroides]|uniref:Phox domain-containing protein n=1 Tax=Thalictrum thalictroides TaxID=46969 RepID=A0A7J6VUU9_THATH|nr:phox domain-containing protein [Thalictrum thalictroides]